MTAAVVKFLTTLKAVFPVKFPRPELEGAWLKAMTKALRGYTAEVLDDAATEIINTYTGKFFPKPAECIKACNEVLKWRNLAKRDSALPMGGSNPFQSPDYSPERVRLADDLVRTDQGRRAAKEGWILSLHDYCRKHGKVPHPSEEPTLKKGAKEFDDAYEECVRGNFVLASTLTDLGDKMRARREELSDMVLHGVERS
jgi:hypothetical protein